VLLRPRRLRAAAASACSGTRRPTWPALRVPERAPGTLPRPLGRPPRRRLGRPLGPALAVALAVAGCGLGADAAETRPGAAPPPARAPSAPAGTPGNPTNPGNPVGPSGPGGSSRAPATTPAVPPGSDPSRPAAGTLRKELPRGGTQIFPRFRLVGYSGAPGSPALGRLGIGDLDARGREIEKLARQYRAGREILPVFELIATMATSFPGKGRLYRTRAGDATISSYLAAARRHRALLLLNVQPGRADFLPEVKAYERWLREPDVGLALDPEWAVGPGQVPGQVYGRTTGAELDGVARYLAALGQAHGLPQKVLVFHQVAPSVVQKQQGLRSRPGVAVVKSVDGIGAPGSKRATWRRLVTGMPPHFHSGFKLFFTEDRRSGPLMTPAQVLALRPLPSYVLYE
jgi:hypothetical protein